MTEQISPKQFVLNEFKKEDISAKRISEVLSRYWKSKNYYRKGIVADASRIFTIDRSV